MPEGYTKSNTDILLEMVSGFARTQELYVCCKLGIPDLLEGKALLAREIACSANCHEDAVQRFLRKLVVHQILLQSEDGRFSLSPIGEFLRTRHPESLCNLVIYVGEVNYPTDSELLHYVRSGRTAFDQAFGMPFFEYLSRNPHHSELFNIIMDKISEPRIAGIVKAYDFTQVKTIVDVGCGKGRLLTRILLAHEDVNGIAFDLPGVVAEAAAQVSRHGVVERCQIVPGSFLEDPIPAGHDLYILSSVIHDWDDDQSVRILRNLCRAMPPWSKLLLIEELMPDRVTDAPATIGNDWNMAKLTGGRERTEGEYRRLLDAAGMVLHRVIAYEPTRINLGRNQNCTIMECWKMDGA